MWKNLKRFYVDDMYAMEANVAAISPIVALALYGFFYCIKDTVRMIMEIVGG